MSFVYYGVLFAVIFWGYIAENNPKYIIKKNGKHEIKPDTVSVIVLSLVLILVAGFRYRVGADYLSYYHWRSSGWEQVWNSITKFKEPGFVLLAYLSKTLVGHGQGLIFITASITIGLYCWIIYKYHRMYLVSILIYLFLGLWQGSFNGVRQYLASAILFSGHRYILEKKLWKYSLVVFTASLFHVTALIMIIPFFILNREADLQQIIIMTIGSIILRFSYDKVFLVIETLKGEELNMNSVYMNREISIFRVLVAFIPVLLYIVFCRKKNQTEEENFYINSLFFNAFTTLAGMGSSYFGRFGIYTNAMVTIGYGHLFLLIDDENSRKLTSCITMTILLLYWLYSLLGAGKYISNYQWIFSHLNE